MNRRAMLQARAFALAAEGWASRASVISARIDDIVPEDEWDEYHERFTRYALLAQTCAAVSRANAAIIDTPEV